MHERDIALVNCTAFDGTREGAVIRDAVVLVRGGRIEAIGSRTELPLPTACERIDLGGRHVLPGLINAHCHLFADGKPRAIASNERLTNAVFRAVGKRPFKQLFKRRIRAQLQNALNAGVTTLRCLGDPWFIDVELRDELERTPGRGPRLWAAGMGIGVTGGHASILSTQSDSPWEFRRAVRKHVREGVDLIKIFTTGGAADSRHVGEAGRLQMTLEEISAACDEAHRAGLRVASHTQSSAGLREALLGGVDSIEHGAELDDSTVDLFLRNERSLTGSTALVPTLSAVLHLGEASLEESKVSHTTRENVRRIRTGVVKGVRRAIKEGIRIGVGSDAAMPLVTHYDFWREVLYLSQYGEVPARVALSWATQGNAELLGIAHETGTLKPGRSADLIAVDEDPLADLRALAHVSFVMSQGRIIRRPQVKRFEQVERTIGRIALPAPA